MRVMLVIPARYGSTRFPGKPLADETGKPLIQHTWERASKASSVDEIVIATDDGRIADAVKKFGGIAELTSPDHKSGSDRIAEVARRHKDVDLIVNLQGDEPEMNHENIDKLVELFRGTDAVLGTLGSRFPSDAPSTGPGSPVDPACVKVVLGGNAWSDPTTHDFEARYAVYFSRSLVPFPRSSDGGVSDPSDFVMHAGIYCYTPDFVIEFSKAARGQAEAMEELEQLRVIEMELPVVIGIVDPMPPGIDTTDDYEAFIARQNEKRANGV